MAPAPRALFQFEEKYGSRCPKPSLTRITAKARPEALTAPQLMFPWNSETSIPSTVAPPAHETRLSALLLADSPEFPPLQAASPATQSVIETNANLGKRSLMRPDSRNARA